jgi:serine/threonine protein kinase/tetratricopeptide (TPR) repeat protein
MNSRSVNSRGYELKEEIGAGGFGVVYRATQPAVGRDVAIKVVLPEIAQDPLFGQLFEQEARVAAQLEHPNIVPLYDYWQDEERAYLVMRWLQGGNLRELLEKGPLDTETAVRLVTQIASALEAAHKRGVIHRDIKPSNILLDEEVNAYLGDFGIAKHAVGKTIGVLPGAIVGSPAYMSPEQITGDEVTTQSDIYSLGLILFEMICGETPFGDVDTVTLLYNQLNDPLPLVCQKNPELPAEVDSVIQQATNKQPSLRFQDALSLSLAFDYALLPGDSFPVIEEEHYFHNLPAQSTPFIGREDEVAALKEYLDDPQTRLLTISGPGGMGKTRLALATAETQVGQFEHGVFFVPLAPVEAAEDVALAIGRAINFSFPGGSDPVRELANYLQRRSMLLVLDNFEHLIEAAPVVTEMIRVAPGLRIIVTTRQRLQLQDEQLFPLQGLSFPSWETPEDAAEYEAVQLFTQSARRVRPDYKLAQMDLAPLTRICRITQGMPLAILLAAGWIELLSPAEIADELAHNLDILETGLQDLPARQRSMRAVFNYTWELLNQQEREHLKKLSVFRAGCSVSAAREITGASLPVLRSLVNKSLLQATSGDRYEVHELLRQFAAGKLAESPDEETQILDAHCAYYLTAVAQREEALFSHRFFKTLDEIESDLDNVRAAWHWAVENSQADLLERAIICLFNYHKWQKNVQFLIKDSQLVVDQFSDSKIARERLVLAWALFFQGWDLSNREDRALVERGLATLRELTPDLSDTSAATAFGLSRLGQIESMSDTDRSRDLLGESLALYEKQGDRHGEASVLLSLSNIAGHNADFSEQERLARASHTIRLEFGNPLEQAESLRIIANSLATQGNYEECLRIGRQLEAIAGTMQDHHAGAVLGMLPPVYRQIGLYKEAYRHYGDVVAAHEDIGDHAMVLSASLWQAWVGLHLGNYRQFLSIAADQKDVYSTRYYLGHLEQGSAAAHLGLGKHEDALEKSLLAVDSFRLGGLLPKLSRSQATLALVLRAMGDVDSARDQLAEAIRLAIEMKSPPVLCYSLTASALILADSGEYEQAVAIYSLALQNPIVANSQWFYDVAGKEIEAIAESLPPADAEAARAQGTVMDLWETANELLNEFQTTSRPN